MKSTYVKMVDRNIACGTRIIVVSDLHMADADYQGYFSPSSCEDALEAVIALANQEKPDELWVLGDMFHMTLRNHGYPKQRLERLATAEVPHVLVIAGNHDSHLLDELSKTYRFKRPEISQAVFIRLTPSAGKQEKAKNPEKAENDAVVGPKIWLTHDGSNPVWLRERQCIPYLKEIRQNWEIPQEDLMLSGHTHRITITDEGRTRSLGVWNIPGHGGESATSHYSYAQVTATDSSFRLEFCNFRCEK